MAAGVEGLRTAAEASMAWDMATIAFSRHFRDLWRGQSPSSPFSLTSAGVIKNSSIGVERTWDQNPPL